MFPPQTCKTSTPTTNRTILSRHAYVGEASTAIECTGQDACPKFEEVVSKRYETPEYLELVHTDSEAGETWKRGREKGRGTEMGGGGGERKFGPIFWKMEHGDPLILYHFLTACAINNRFWQKNWHILFDPKLSRATLNLNINLTQQNQNLQRQSQTENQNHTHGSTINGFKIAHININHLLHKKNFNTETTLRFHGTTRSFTAKSFSRSSGA